ncbi:hypothetical protein BAUCODRAFT_575155 [Baudoinia panamericana UAMH 10762]|uniref:Uncharacterized protein n=1 Tax=Baudoinia panamericana (strain UAMH 10762) TaxID=717646 RepID=M2NEA6_BAUPA|nr:uncharacterized protein BAUCODRAFT_575155 [Baudoinia panamericana UAMH 10762]EMC97290.1 hypothetical protein BAUCODRAFT_575155 [Baudoinia panamericana UAMH 10762]
MRFGVCWRLVLAIVLLILAPIALLLSVYSSSLQHSAQDYSLFTVNTSRIGSHLYTELSTTLKNCPPRSKKVYIPGAGAIASVITTGASQILCSLRNEVETVVADIEQNVHGSFAQAFRLHDFYSFHLLSVCYGYYTPSAISNATYPSPGYNVTGCSNLSDKLDIQPGYMLRQDIAYSDVAKIVNLTSLDWPPKLDEQMKTLQSTFLALLWLDIIAAGVTCCYLCTVVTVIFTYKNTIAALAVWLGIPTSLLTISLGSLATYMRHKAVAVVTELGAPVGVAAGGGWAFIGLLWAAFSAESLGTVLLWLAQRTTSKCD